MLVLYLFTVALITTLGLAFIIKSFVIPSEKGKWGFILFTLTYFIHDSFLMFMSYIDSVPIQCIEYVFFYIISFVIIKCGFQGNGVKNFIWIYGANFIYQAIATVVSSVIMGAQCNFDHSKIEQIGDRPSIINCIFLAITALIGAITGKAFTKILLKRNNRIIQVAISLLAATGILAGAINSAESFYIIFPILITALVAGMLYQDKMLRMAEKQEQYYHQLDERQRIRQEELSKIRHDLANHISVIDSTGNAEYAREVLKSIDGELKSGDPIIDCLLDEKIRSCKENGIKIAEQIMNLAENSVSNFDWVSLLANLLDNAIEACEKTDEEKSIELEIKRNRDYVVLSMANSKRTDEKPIDNKFKTTKEQSKYHGYGTKIIKDIVNKYQGRIRYEDMGDRFITHITMKAW